jgi:hypothetical protein
MLRKLSSNQELWVPGQGNDLSTEYPVPTQDELAEKWREYDPDANIIEAPGVYGVVAKPINNPEIFVSLDIDEVVRTSHLAIRSIIKVYEEQFPGNSIHSYGEETCLENPSDYQAILRIMMNNGLVRPVHGIEQIAEIIEEASENGAYIFANTSTLEGTELGTIDFIKEHIPKGIKGVAFPRNHEGTLPLTKGVVSKNIVDEFSDPNKEIYLAHIDDAPHHNISVRAEIAKRPRSTSRTFMPEYKTHLPADLDSELVETPLAAFQAMRKVLQNWQSA